MPGRSARIKFHKKDVIPIIIFILFLTLLIISTNLTGRPPVIESLSKQTCRPGDLISVYGNYFGEKQGNGMVLISGKPISSRFQEWENKKISFIVPEKMESGLVCVRTARGESKEPILILNREEIPEVVAGPSRPGAPHITELSPGKAPTGAVVTLKGVNFGHDRTNGNVFFTWISGEEEGQDKPNKQDLFASLVPTLAYDFDFISWSDREIQVRIPDGAFPGPVLVATDKGVSSPLYLEVEEPVGKKSYEDKRTYQLSYSVQINNINAEQDNGLYLWLARVAAAPEQREIKLIFSDPQPRLENYRGTMQFYFPELLPGGKYQLRLSFMFDRYAVTTNIANPYRISNKYELSREHLASYFHSDSLIPAGDKNVTRVARSVVRGIANTYNRSNPYYIARVLYDYIISGFEYENAPLVFRDNLGDLLAAGEGKANALDISLLYCALLRNQDVPARPVGGFLINDLRQSHPHFWVEFYIEKFGWVPVDPVLGSGAAPLDFSSRSNPAEYYFGNLDNQHITLTKGVVELNQMSPRGKVISSLKFPALQTIYEESIGKLHSYSSAWSNLEDVGIY